MADLDLRRLRYFVTLAATLNYGQAAQTLHITQPALSRSISTLERELGVTLFERSRAGTKLTAAGELLRDEAQALLHSAQALQQRLRQADRESLTVGFMPGLILTPLVRHHDAPARGDLLELLLHRRRRLAGSGVGAPRKNWLTSPAIATTRRAWPLSTADRVIDG
ncbi:LysR family transcriptional regulator [Kineosporia sp. NBRC 101731]|uniref:LysR family transcriptional regulator n=1 Tax=Kineosporia sp. NBRC 101731 TaxID=3032199 RepID=UPI0024A30779|nr:LysR family transcriptional regulator [Kineosporia sp. NBRC 101731]GLY29075.1 hypothetical protein Kisp02_24400 [Kineosporia sp. NBRC 101731]